MCFIDESNECYFYNPVNNWKNKIPNTSNTVQQVINYIFCFCEILMKIISELPYPFYYVQDLRQDKKHRSRYKFLHILSRKWLSTL